MRDITIMEVHGINKYKEHWLINLIFEKEVIESKFDWLTLEIRGKSLIGKGSIFVKEKKYEIELVYSPFLGLKMDSIKILNLGIQYHDDIHVYDDLSLCLYHPVLDRPITGIIPLHKMIPWISEWCHFYEQWKKYSVWLGREIKHSRLG